MLPAWSRHELHAVMLKCYIIWLERKWRNQKAGHIWEKLCTRNADLSLRGTYANYRCIELKNLPRSTACILYRLCTHTFGIHFTGQLILCVWFFSKKLLHAEYLYSREDSGTIFCLLLSGRQLIVHQLWCLKFDGEWATKFLSSISSS